MKVYCIWDTKTRGWYLWSDRLGHGEPVCFLNMEKATNWHDRMPHGLAKHLEIKELTQ